MINILDRLWNGQREYNLKIRAKEFPDNYEYWMKQYLLGAISEVDEVLNEINWKIHRRGRPIDRHNLARELADLTKYVFSLWELSGFSYKDMLKFVLAKTAELDEQHRQEFESVVPDGAPVVISDVDGTLADYRTSFYNWLEGLNLETLPKDTGANLAMEIDLGLPYNVYNEYKEQFEAQGGYRSLTMYPEVSTVLLSLWEKGVYIINYTARPAAKYSRIWNDTWSWMLDHGLTRYVSELRIGSEQRIGRACELKDKGHNVILLEDDPGSALRAAYTGITVYLRNQPYNVGLDHDNIIRVDKFDSEDLWFHLNPERRNEWVIKQ